MKKFILILSLFISCRAFAQIGINYYYKPGLNELETDLYYRFENNFSLGIKHNQEKNYFVDLKDRSLTYLYVQIPIIDNFKFELVGGYGYTYDYECSLVYDTPRFQFTIGRSLTDIIVFDIKYLIYYEKR